MCIVHCAMCQCSDILFTQQCHAMDCSWCQEVPLVEILWNFFFMVLKVEEDGQRSGVEWSGVLDVRKNHFAFRKDHFYWNSNLILILAKLNFMTTTTARAEQNRVGNFTRAWPPSVIALHCRHVCRIYNGGWCWCQSFKFYINNSATFRILIFSNKLKRKSELRFRWIWRLLCYSGLWWESQKLKVKMLFLISPQYNSSE